LQGGRFGGARSYVDDLVTEESLGAQACLRVRPDLLAHLLVDGEGDTQHLVGLSSLVDGHEIDGLDLPDILAGETYTGPLDEPAGARH
jgi:hypothetical protein